MFDDRSFKAKKGFSSLIIITFDFFSMFNCDMSRFNKDFCYKTDFSSDDYTLVEPLCFSKMEERNSSGGKKKKKKFWRHQFSSRAPFYHCCCCYYSLLVFYEEVVFERLKLFCFRFPIVFFFFFFWTEKNSRKYSGIANSKPQFKAKVST